MPKNMTTRGERPDPQEKPSQRFLKTDENAPPKSKKGSQRNPNKKRNKKPTLAEKVAADARGHVAAVALSSPHSTPTADRRKRVPFQTLQSNVVFRSPTESPEARIVLKNSFDVLPLQDLGRSPSPFESLVAPTSVKKVSKRRYKKRNFLDALAAFEDLEFLDFHFDIDVSVPVVEAPAFEPERQAVAVTSPEVVVVDAATEQQVGEKPRNGFFIRALRAVGKVVANVAAAAFTLVRIARSCF
ncbi:hypothetical protein Ndes2526A_g01309 [Nannochloris sp. 'desiccata']|nr:hypothetical protein KSW81_004338 [Chlorella desiccata (nom. nud.)]